MTIALVFRHEDLILNVEMAFVILKIDVFAHDKTCDNRSHHLCGEAKILGHHFSQAGIPNLPYDVFGSLLSFSAALNQLTNVVNVFFSSAQHTKVLLVQVISMNDVEHVLEGIDSFLLYASKFVQEGTFRHGVRLGDNQVIAVGEFFERILEEIFAAAVERGFHAEQRDSEGILH